MRKIAIVEVADLFIYYFRQDHAFTYAMQDERAREVSANEISPRWTASSVNPEDAWGLRGMGLFSLASIHYWRHGIDFAYFDIGANVGMTTAAQAVFYKRCGRPNKVYAFEPGDVFPLLAKTVQANKVDDITLCLRAAASDEAGKVQFHVTPAQSPASSLLNAAVSRPGVVESQAIIVDSVRIDDFLNSVDHTDGLLIKIDAEGADFKVLDGMGSALSDRLCTLQIEFFPDLVASYTDPLQRLLSLSQDFFMVDVGPTALRGLILPDAITVSEYVNQVRQQTMPASDIMLIPKRLPGVSDLVKRLQLEC